jgi:hypothetical protein
MVRKYTSHFIISLTIITFLAAGCSSGPPERMTLEKADAPDWVVKGGGAKEDSNGRAFYGVGSASGIKNFSLQRTVADDRARNDIAKVFEFYTKSLTKDYQASTTAGDFSATSEEQNVESAIKTVTSATLSGIQIIDHWEHPYRNEMFSLARLDLEKFKENLNRYKELSEAVRNAVKQRADRLHEEMEGEVLKKDNR